MNLTKRVSRSSRYQLYALLAFWFSVFWAFTSALPLDRNYQDSWILESIWLPLTILLLSYIVYISLADNLSRITLLTSAVAFLLFALPALKYHFIYGSAIDQATHFDLIRSLPSPGRWTQVLLMPAPPAFRF